MYMYDDTEFLLQGEGVREGERFTLLSAGVRALHSASAFVNRLCQAGTLQNLFVHKRGAFALRQPWHIQGGYFLYTRYLCCLLRLSLIR